MGTSSVPLHSHLCRGMLDLKTSLRPKVKGQCSSLLVVGMVTGSETADWSMRRSGTRAVVPSESVLVEREP